jgi:hypothetical protein
MAWENIEEKLKKALTVKVSFPAGAIWLPDVHLSIDDWLTSIAETDEELQELNIPRIRFLQNRWLIDSLVELEWDDAFASRRVIMAMYVGQRAYILFSDWSEYQVIAAVEPKNSALLYQSVVDKLLANRNFIRVRPARVVNRRTDLLPDLPGGPGGAGGEEGFGSRGQPPEGIHAGSKSEKWKGFLSDVLVGWIGKWLTLPELGFWHEQMPESIAGTKEGDIHMRYKPSYGDKQRDAQKRKKEEQAQTETPPVAADTEPPTEPIKNPKTETKKPEKRREQERNRAS